MSRRIKDHPSVEKQQTSFFLMLGDDVYLLNGDGGGNVCTLDRVEVLEKYPVIGHGRHGTDIAAGLRALIRTVNVQAGKVGVVIEP